MRKLKTLPGYSKHTNNDAAFVVYAFGQSMAVHVCNGTGILDEQKIGQLSDT